jgi:hypothetical protein
MAPAHVAVMPICSLDRRPILIPPSPSTNIPPETECPSRHAGRAPAQLQCPPTQPCGWPCARAEAPQFSINWLQQ